MTYDRKDFVKTSLYLGTSYYHLPRIEEFWEDYEDEYEVRKRDWMQFTLEKIKQFELKREVNEIEDDLKYSINHVYSDKKSIATIATF